jgi:hypothetical protein
MQPTFREKPIQPLDSPRNLSDARNAFDRLFKKED